MSKLLAVVILTFNEEIHLARALKNVAAFAGDVFVIDAFSTDRTAEIAREHGATVLQHAWTNYAQQFQWGLDSIQTDATWILRLDADELIEDDLAARIRAELPTLPADVVGINIDRKHIFLGRWIKHGGRYPLRLLRIFRRGHGAIEQRWMDEHLIVWGGSTVHFAGGFADHNLNDLTFFTHKHNHYATREAIDVLNQKLQLFSGSDISTESTSRQAAIKRFMKEKMFNRMPFGLSTLLYFLYRYFIQLGFLDGTPGLIYHFLQGYWYRFLVGAKIVELEQAIGHLTDKGEIRAELARLTKLKL